LGKVEGFEATIDTGENQLPHPAAQRPVGPTKREVIADTLNTLLDWDVIKHSISPTASALVLILQNGKWRMCVDFTKLNAITVGDSYRMLRSDYVFEAVGRKQYLSLLDAMKGYNQLSLAEKDREKTAFISHRGLFQYKRLPFELKNAPAQFQRLMDVLLGSLRWVCALVYIDDIVIYTDT